ncbi:MAG: hypothetical protein HQL95_13740 [Magnetococcales bacterium]|nr:hypothetical protein [Magnetococcales bacterium]
MKLQKSIPGWPVAIALLLLASGSAQAGERSHWQTDFGPVKLRVESDGRVNGTYPDYQGTLEGDLDNNRMDLYWYQPKSDVRCHRPKGGTHYWGRVHWRVSGNRLSGSWSYCDRSQGSGGQWNGHLTSGVAPGEGVRERSPGYQR